MKVTGSTIQQLDKLKPSGKPIPKSECRRWRLWATTECGRKSERFNGTYTQAQERLKAFVAGLEGHVPNSDTFGAYAESWALWREKSGQFAPGTMENDRREVRALRRSALDGMRMDAITPPDCREALAWLKEHPSRPTRTGRLSNTTMNSLHVCMHAILQQAVDDGLLAANPMARLKAPRPDTEERAALSRDELDALLGSLDALPLDGRVMAVYFMACLGLRRGEACALPTASVKGGVCSVTCAVKERDGSIGEPKSPAAKRALPMPPRLASKTVEWLSRRRAIGLADAPTLCCNTQGGILRPQLLQRWWTGDATHGGVRDGLGVPGIGLHQLRHSNLSIMARHMSVFDLQRYAGWSSIEPAKVYVHADFAAMGKAVADAWR